MDSFRAVCRYINSHSELTKHRLEQFAREDLIDVHLASCDPSQTLEYYKTLTKYNRSLSTKTYAASLADSHNIHLENLRKIDQLHNIVLTDNPCDALRAAVAYMKQ